MKTTLLSLLLITVAGCLPQAKEQSCSEGSVFNSASRGCIPITAGGNTSGISISNRSPLGANVAVVLGSSAPSPFTVTLSNPASEGYSVQWKLYPPSGTTFTQNPVATNTQAYNFIPANYAQLTLGLWTLAAEIYNPAGTVLYTSAQWAISVSTATAPSITINSPAGTTFARTTIDSSLLTLNINVNDPAASTSWSLQWYYDGNAKGAAVPGSGSVNNLTSTFFLNDVTFPQDNPPLSVGQHVIRAEITSGATVYDSQEWTVFVSPPNLPQISTGVSAPAPVTSTTVIAVNGVALNVLNSFKTGTQDLFTTSQDFCVAVTDGNGTQDWPANAVSVTYLSNGAPAGIGYVSTVTNNTHFCLGDLNPTFNMTLVNPSVGEFQILQAIVKDEASGLTIATVQWNVSVRPKNTAPEANISLPPSAAVTQAQGPGGSTLYSITGTDADTTLFALGVSYFVDGVAMNGTNTFPGTTVPTPTCTYAVGAGPADSTRFDCIVDLPTYGLLGRLNASHTYTITANVSDATTFGGAPQNSNIVQWNVSQTQGTNRLSVLAPEGADATSAPTTLPTDGLATTEPGNSFVALLATPTTPITDGNFVAEAQNVVFSILVKDDDRDNFVYTISQCPDVTCATYSPITAATQVNRSNAQLGRRVTYSYQLPEDLVTAGLNGQVFYRIGVQDKLPDGSLGTEVFEIIDLDITNYNPFPLWAGTGNNPGLGDALSVVTGMPLSIDPGAITDSSTGNGSTIAYQWQTSIDAGVSWVSITGATQRVLKWTPATTVAGSNVRFRLCLGDNGSDGTGTSTDNSLALCTGVATPAAPSAPALSRFVGPWTGVTARSNSLAIDGTLNANGDVATWFDPSDRSWYVGYVNLNGSDDATIVIEKHEISANGVITLSKLTSFPSENSGTAYDASRLNLVGQSTTVSGRTYKNLYVSYVVQSASALVPPALRIRKFDITEGELSFDYSNVTEADETTDNISMVRTSAHNVELTVNSITFDAGDYITINGIRLNAVTASPSSCDFMTGGALSTADVAQNISDAYDDCMTATSDARDFSPAKSVAASVITFTNMPQPWVNLGYSLALGKTGETMLNGTHLLVPFLDGFTGGKISVVVIDTMEAGVTTGALGTTSSVAASSAVTLPSTVAGQDLANASNGSSSFDVALVNATSGINAYRITFTAPLTVAVTNSVATSGGVFGASFFVEKPRIASGSPSTNNHVYIVATDSSSLDGELAFARIDASTYSLAPGMPTIPLHMSHEQGRGLEDYRLSALPTNKSVAMSVLTSDFKVLASVIKPLNVSSDLPLVYPTSGAGVTYPAVASGVSVANPVLAMSQSSLFELGDFGSVAAENTKAGVVIFHPTATSFNASFVNMALEGIQATAIGNAFQPAYVK